MRTWWIVLVSVIVLAGAANGDPIRSQKVESAVPNQDCTSLSGDFRTAESQLESSLLVELRRPAKLLDRDFLEELTCQAGPEAMEQTIHTQPVPDIPDLTLYQLPYELLRLAGL